MSSGRAPGEPLVAIDGAGGSGKSTLARRLALELDTPYLNTGLMYRSLARRTLDGNVDPSDADALAELARGLRFALGGEAPAELEVDGRRPDSDLLAADVEEIVSDVSRHQEVRRVMVEEQRRLGERGGVIEGRDIGSAVFPGAKVKIFLDASPRVRALRRAAERSTEGDGDHERALERRNERDARTVPHEPTPDAVVIDTTEMDAAQVLSRALDAVRAVWPAVSDTDRPRRNGEDGGAEDPST